MEFDCVSIGDAVFDVYLTLHDAVVQCKLDKADCQICLPYGDKIPVERIDRALGGNAANNVVALKRLGFQTAFLTIHGDDQIGERIDQYLGKERIDRSLIQIERGTDSRYSTILNFKGERTILEYQVPRRYVIPENFPETKWIYVSSVGPEYQEFFKELSDLVNSKKIKLAFNPANQQLNNSLETYLELVKVCEIVFMNVEEAYKLLGREEGKGDRAQGTVKNLLSEIYELGPKVVVITDGKNGSYSYDGNNYYYMEIMDKPVVSPTGAGDAYASGFMAALMKGRNVEEAMKWGTINSAAVIGQFGPQTGLLTLKEMEEMLETCMNLKPKLV